MFPCHAATAKSVTATKVSRSKAIRLPRSRTRRGAAISRSTRFCVIRSRAKLSIRSAGAPIWTTAFCARLTPAHFGEDSLRVLRAMQFAGRFGLSIHAATAALCRNTPLDDLPAERVWGEWEKWLLKSPKPSLGLIAGSEIGVFSRLFPSIQTAIERRGAALENALDGAALLLNDLEMPHQVALMLATIGSFLGWRDTKAMLDTLGIAKMKGEKQAIDVRTLTIQLVGARKTPRDWFARRQNVEDKEFRFFSARIHAQLATFLSRARGDSEAADWFEKNLRRLNVWDGPPAPLLLGRHLLEMGMTPGQKLAKLSNRFISRS